jgi:transcriptional regulator with XRE-family HTH domain
MSDIGDRIRKERVIWGMTQTDLAEASTIDRTAISKIETGARKVSAEELETFARVFQVPVDQMTEPRPIIQYRVNTSLQETQQAIAWFERCIDNSLFVRRLPSLHDR